MPKYPTSRRTQVPIQANVIYIPPADESEQSETAQVQCRFCEKSMVKASKWRHEKDCEQNPDRGEPQHKCEKCGRTFRRRDSMVRHQDKRESGVCPPPRSTPSTPAMSGPSSPPPALVMAQPNRDYHPSTYSSLLGALLEDDSI